MTDPIESPEAFAERLLDAAGSVRAVDLDAALPLIRARDAAVRREAQQWRPLTDDPASWPEEGQAVAILWRDRRTSTATLRDIRGANAFEPLVTHWHPLPPPPKEKSE